MISVALRKGLLAAVLIWGLPAGTATAMEPTDIACSGVFTKDATPASFVRAFGKDNVVNRRVESGNGAFAATVLFPNNPARRLTVFWYDETKRQHPALIVADDPASVWTVANIGIGATLEAVEAANGRPFEIDGFRTDGGGVTDMKRGRLDFNAFGEGCAALVAFDFPGAPQVPPSFAGERRFMSNDPALRAAKPVVVRVGLRLTFSQ